MLRYDKLAIGSPNDLCFGTAPRPLRTKMGMTIGGGTVYPELNFTLPAITVEESTWPKVTAIYRDIIEGALARAAELECPGVVIECETLPPMTYTPAWAREITRILLDAMTDANAKTGLKSVLRMTPNDNREMIRPPEMRSGFYYDKMIETFRACAEEGAELLSIESVGGKEVHDDALIMADIRHVIYALCVMGVSDMRFLWEKIVAIAGEFGVYAAGDTACGFGNTAMVLAEKRMIPRVFAAVVRVVTAVRSLVAYEAGAVGPGKDCGYENAYLKAITGFPMSMEGKTAACAHLSPLGNIAAATCDLWSNESVQHVKLLGGMAPTCYMEQLEYDCRLMNVALREGKASALKLRDWLTTSDATLDPQAWILTPKNVITLAGAIVSAEDHYAAGRSAALKAVEVIRDGIANHGLKVAERELPFLDLVESTVQSMPDDVDEFCTGIEPELDQTKFRLQDYRKEASCCCCGKH